MDWIMTSNDVWDAVENDIVFQIIKLSRFKYFFEVRKAGSIIAYGERGHINQAKARCVFEYRKTVN